MQQLFDGTKAHGFFKISEPLNMRCAGCWSDFFSNDAILAPIFQKYFTNFPVELVVIVPRETEPSHCSVTHVVTSHPPRPG